MTKFTDVSTRASTVDLHKKATEKFSRVYWGYRILS